MSDFNSENEKKVMYKKKDTKRRKKRKKRIYNAVIVLLCLVLSVCLFNIGSYFWQDFSNDSLNDDLAGDIVSYSEDISSSVSGSSSSGSEGGSGSKREVAVPESIDFEKLKAQNKDVVGWIFSKNGVINYPILQGDDNSYYLNHLINGKKNINGSIFMDYAARSDFSGAKTVVFGHSMDNGSMFRTLLNYKKQSYYEKYPEMYIYTPDGNYKLVIFAAYESNANDLAYIKIRNEDGFNTFVEHALAKSKVKTGVEVKIGDRLVCLSTCAYSSKDARFVVAGKLVSVSDNSSSESSSGIPNGYYASIIK